MPNTNEKEKLLNALKKYKDILSLPMIEYLISLIELEFSVIRDYINDFDREILSELQIYRDIVRYNIYNRAITIFNDNKKIYPISISTFNGNLEVYSSVDNNPIKLFEFASNPDINFISLYQTKENVNLRNEEIYMILVTLEKLYDLNNPYKINTENYLLWDKNKNKQIKNYEKLFEQLDKKEINDIELQEIEITSYFQKLLLEDYELTNKSFESTNSEFITGVVGYKDIMNKKLIKKLPIITIEKHIKYI